MPALGEFALQERATLIAENARLREACELIAERLEAWAEAHHACAMHMPASEDVTVQQNIRDNYRALVNRLRAALKATP